MKGSISADYLKNTRYANIVLVKTYIIVCSQVPELKHVMGFDVLG